MKAGISGSRSCTIHKIWCCVLGHWQTGGASSTGKTLRNGLICPIDRHPEVAGDRGRRPHVPSSKTTMSKSRRRSNPVFIRGTGLPIGEARTGRARSRAPSVRSHIWRPFPAVNGFFRKTFQSRSARGRSIRPGRMRFERLPERARPVAVPILGRVRSPEPSLRIPAGPSVKLDYQRSSDRPAWLPSTGKPGFGRCGPFLGRFDFLETFQAVGDPRAAVRPDGAHIVAERRPVNRLFCNFVMGGGKGGANRLGS